MKNIQYSVAPRVSVVPGSFSGTTARNGSGVDTMGFADARAVCHVGAATGTPDSYTVTWKIQESSDNGSSDAFADVSGLTAVCDADNELVTIDIPNVGTVRERYLRVVGTPAFTGGSTPTVPGVGIIELGKAVDEPVS